MGRAQVTDLTDLVDRLAGHKLLGGVPRRELEWLAAHGELRSLAAGESMLATSSPVEEMFIVLTGHFSIYFERETGRRKMTEWFGGDVSGYLPFSRMKTVPTRSNVTTDEATEVVAVNRSHFPELIIQCPNVLAELVHVMLDRARLFTSTDWQDEKMMSLGRLAAGLAHELNNPASAVVRSAKLLGDALREAEEAATAFGEAALSVAEREGVAAIRDRSLIPATTGVFSALERSDRDDDIQNWLEAHGAETAPGGALAESGVTIDALDELATTVSGEKLDVALRLIASGYATRSLATDIERASRKIHELVSSVKRFTFMDQAGVLEPLSITQGVTDTVAVLASKARAKSVTVRLDLPANLPTVNAYGGELNQVWSNLLENAIDAVAQSGEVDVSATLDGEQVVVRFIDNGSGIPPDIKGRIFDPFFTTKPMGQGTGLGLDISRRIVQRHGGYIEVESVPGRTEFRICLPLTAKPSPAAASPALSSPR